MTWTAYNMMPIDFGWEILPSVEDVAAQLARAEAAEALSNDEFPNSAGLETYANFMSNFEKAKELAKSQGWEGDYREEPKVFWLPDENEFAYGFVWKQDNNGNTFVVSPRPLAWLPSLC